MRYKLRNKNAGRRTQDAQRNGFSLIEVLVGIIVFGFVLSAAGGVLYHIQKAWQRQRDDMLYIQNARWALEFMSREMRGGDDASVNIGPGPNQWRITYDFSSTTERKYRYWYGGKGDVRIIYGGGWGVGNSSLLVEGCVVQNPGGKNAFDQEYPADLGLITIEISTGDKNPDNRRFHLRTKVRMRN